MGKNIRPDTPENPILELTDSDVVAVDGVQPRLIPRATGQLRFNVVRGVLEQSSAHNYESTEFEIRDTDVITNDGEERVHDLGIVRYVNDVIEVLQKAAQMLRSQRFSLSMPDYPVIPTIETLNLQKNDPILITNEFLSMVQMPFRVIQSRRDDEDNIVWLTLGYAPYDEWAQSYLLAPLRRFQLSLRQPETPKNIDVTTERNVANRQIVAVVAFTNRTFYPTTRFRWRKTLSLIHI